MALVKLEIDGKRVTADSNQTILEVARQQGIHDIPTLCHDGQLEPFASCFVCVVHVKGARGLLPSCATKVTNGMVVNTRSPEVKASRKAALELLLSNHYADCIGPCRFACPAGVDIQGYIALVALDKYADAVALIKEKNPLPSVCGRVCTRPCEVKGCRRNLLDEPVAIDFIKRYVTDVELGRADQFQPELATPTGRRVAVVGGGPAGLSCAYYLAQRGHKVDVFEALPEPGGMLRYGIPEYRLPKEVLDQEIGQILALGVTLKTNVALGRDFTVRSLKADGYGAIFLGIGAWASSEMRVKGEDTAGVLSGIEFLKLYGLKRPVNLHGKVLVVGGGNTAIDCARTALRLGAAEVHIVYRRTEAEMPANKAEIHDAKEEGVILDFLVAPTRVVSADGKLTGLECQRMELGEPDASGRRSPKPVKGSEFVMDCDFILAAIGQATKVKEVLAEGGKDMLPAAETLSLTRWQTISTDERSGETTIEGVFSGGDVVTGAATAIEAIAAGRKSAHAIHEYLTGGKVKPEPVEFYSRKDTFGKVTREDLRSLDSSKREQMPMLDPKARIKTFQEVETGLDAGQVLREAMRCQECGCTALFDCSLRDYGTEYGVDVKRFLGEATHYKLDRRHPLIDLDMNKCILCGRCVRICSEVVGVAAYGFVNRGFLTAVKPEMDGALLDTGCVSCGLCVSTCPTGAIAEKVPLQKPGPFKTEKTATVCTYCGVGCRLDAESFGGTLVQMARREDDPVTQGGHCRRGFFGYRHVHAGDRLRTGLVRNGLGPKQAPVAEAIAAAATLVRQAGASGDEVAVFLSPRLTNEEIYLAQKLARMGLKTHNVTSFARLVNRDLHAPDVLSTATYRDVAGADAVVLANTVLDEEHFVVDLATKRVVRGGGKVVYVHPDANRVAHFADFFLQCKPGTQAEVVGALARVAVGGAVDADLVGRTGVDGAALAEAAKAVAGAVRKVLVFNRDFRGARTIGDARAFAAAAASMGCGLLAMHEKSNMQGLLDLGGAPDRLPGYRPVANDGALDFIEKAWSVALHQVPAPAADVAALLRDRKVKVAVVLGEDPLGTPDLPQDLKDGLRAARVLIVGDLFVTETAKAAHVVLPLSAAVETSGTVTNSERRIQRLARAIPAPTGWETWQILVQFASRLGLGFRMQYAGPGEVFAEIKRVTPIYARVEPDAADSRWDATLPIEAAVPPAGIGTAVTPTATLALDVLEARWAAWFDDAVAKAKGTAEA